METILEHALYQGVSLFLVLAVLLPLALLLLGWLIYIAVEIIRELRKNKEGSP